jgi:formylglycine-generating enzyme required for sulfatase activity
MIGPKRIGKYEILEEIGRGGFAVVYRARDTELERGVALKVLHPYWTEEADFAARFGREARAAARLRHPHVVTVYDAGDAGGQLYIAMEYLPGRTLHALLEAEGALPLERALPILEQVAGALDYAHRQGVVHRDVKPGNIVVEETEQGVQATLMDFGLVKAMSGSSVLTSQGKLLGSPEYMAPEQADPDRVNQIGPATDRYALGIVAYQMLTGRVPFPGNTPATLNAHEHKPVPRPRSLRPELSGAVEVTLLKMLAKNPSDRFPSACAFVDQLREELLAERQTHQGETQLVLLYGRLQAAAAQEDWAEVLALGGQIRALDAGYRDVVQRMVQAREQLRRPQRRSMSTWAWGVGVAGLLSLVVLLGVGVILGSQLLEAFSAPTDERTLSIGTAWTRSVDEMVMLYVQAGEFQMGSDMSDPDADEDEFPQHPVTLDSFWIDQTEVTNAQFAAFLNEQGNRTEGGVTWLDLENKDCLIERLDGEYGPKSGYADHPVIMVSWYGAAAYCEWAGARLPTEAEWEYAARGPQGFIYPWGDDFDCSRGNFDDETQLDEYVVPGGAECDGYMRTAPARSFPNGTSWCKALDMVGNVWEWVADCYGVYPSAAQANPTGPKEGDHKVLRGGGWGLNQRTVRAADRSYGTPIDRYDSVGFRCAGQPGG